MINLAPFAMYAVWFLLIEWRHFRERQLLTKELAILRRVTARAIEINDAMLDLPPHLHRWSQPNPKTTLSPTTDQGNSTNR